MPENQSTGTSRRSKIVLGLLLVAVLFVFGVYFAFVRPEQLVSEAREKATLAIGEADSTLQRADLQSHEMAWFKPSYLEQPKKELKEGRKKLEETKRLFAVDHCYRAKVTGIRISFLWIHKYRKILSAEEIACPQLTPQNKPFWGSGFSG